MLKPSLITLFIWLTSTALVAQPPPWAEKVIKKSQNEVVWHWCAKSESQKMLTLSLFLDNKLVKLFQIPIRRDRRGGGIDSTPIEDDKFEFILDHSRHRETFGPREGNIWACASEPNALLVGIMAWKPEDTGSEDPRTINDRMWIPINKSVTINLGDGVKMVSKITLVKLFNSHAA